MRTIEWLNINSYRRYPLQDDCDYSTQSGGTSFIFQNDVILDFKLITYTLAVSKVTLESFEVIDNSPAPKVIKFALKLWYSTGDLTVFLSIPENAVCPYTATNFVDGNYNLKCIFGPGIVSLAALPVGVYQFLVSPEILKSLIIMQHMHSVNKIIGTQEDSVDLSGIVYFEEGCGIKITLDSESNTITLAAIPGAGKGFSCDVLPNTRDNAIIKTINGIKPTSDGNIELAGSNGVEIIPDIENHTVIIESKVDPSNIECGEA